LGGGKGELLVKGETSVEAGGNWQGRVEGVTPGVLRTEGGRTEEKAVEPVDEPMEMELLPGRDRGLDRPETKTKSHLR